VGWLPSTIMALLMNSHRISWAICSVWAGRTCCFSRVTTAATWTQSPRDGAEDGRRGRTLYTIGHSTRTTRELVELLRAHGVEQVVDVRIMPKSRHNPQFNRPARSRSLRAVKIGYRHLKALGGLRLARPRAA
jgi:hypothetical protein